MCGQWNNYRRTIVACQTFNIRLKPDSKQARPVAKCLRAVIHKSTDTHTQCRIHVKDVAVCS